MGSQDSQGAFGQRHSWSLLQKLPLGCHDAHIVFPHAESVCDLSYEPCRIGPLTLVDLDGGDELSCYAEAFDGCTVCCDADRLLRESGREQFLESFFRQPPFLNSRKQLPSIKFRNDIFKAGCRTALPCDLRGGCPSLCADTKFLLLWQLPLFLAPPSSAAFAMCEQCLRHDTALAHPPDHRQDARSLACVA